MESVAAVREGGTTVLQYLAAASGNLAIVTDGMHYGWPSPSLIQLVNNTNSSLCMSNEEGAVMAVMPLIGAIIGAATAANIVDYFGRKKTILGTSVPFFIAWIMIALAKSVIVLHIARFIAGIADGVTFTVVPMYIGEISDAKVRGLLGSSCSALWIGGFLLINVIGSYLSISTTALVSSIVPLLAFVTFIWMPESPYYLLMRERVKEAKASLRKFRGVQDVDEEIERMSTYIQTKSRKSGRFLDLFRVRSNRKAVFIIAGLRGFQQFSGTTAISFYAQAIFKEAGDDISPEHASMIYFSVMFLVTIISSSIVDKAGRKPLLMISMAGSCLALFLEGTYFYIKSETSIDTQPFDYMPVAVLIGFVIIFSIGMQSIPILMLGELFPTGVKAFALCLADIYYSVVASIASKFLQVMKDNYGMYFAFYGFCIFSVIGLLFIYFFVPETKGKNLEEIQRYLRGRGHDHSRCDNKDEYVKVSV
ncbi:hypothetical protein NQ315_001145 [Exocentrus adspersus]|uniref:Major facilitator superfamily (MFS) profile domain-containing protein n=1 Tax=Exocentrus adspersus TaxID=1586481 RepID=A0AAV8WFW9_9CUCU|nr:hypothetical protein NQ315_001145 [Exocentrus adspersus]